MPRGVPCPFGRLFFSGWISRGDDEIRTHVRIAYYNTISITGLADFSARLHHLLLRKARKLLKCSLGCYAKFCSLSLREQRNYFCFVSCCCDQILNRYRCIPMPDRIIYFSRQYRSSPFQRTFSTLLVVSESSEFHRAGHPLARSVPCPHGVRLPQQLGRITILNQAPLLGVTDSAA